MAKNQINIHDIFDCVVEQYPDRVALVYGSKKLTYRQLYQNVNVVACHLSHLGVSGGAVVALHLERSFNLIISMLAVLKCGAAYIPLDLSAPEERKEACLISAKACCIISNRTDERLAKHSCVHVDSNKFDFSECTSSKFTSNTTDVAQAAYIMFTSGSTGEPKGVIVPHRAITRLVVDTDYIDITVGDSILQFSPVSFDASTFEIWGALLNGAKLVLYSGTVLDPNLLKREIEEHAVTIMWLTSALFHVVANSFIDALRTVKTLLAGGDVLNPVVVRRVLEAVPGIVVINGYGPTENTTFTCCHRMTSDNPPDQTVPIGRAIRGTEVHILDEQMRPVAKGEIGELYAAGDGVALGYLNQPEGLAAFLNNQMISPSLIYRTGDLVQENSQGEILFLGRLDDQIKIRGFRVSLEEVKRCVMQIDGVSDAAITTQSFESGDQILVAYVQLNEGQNVDAAQIKRNLVGRIPEYMVPDKIVLTSALPITKNGKLDKKKLTALVN